MNRLAAFVALGLIAAGPGCTRKPDPVVAAFANNYRTTNRIVFYASGKYEYYYASTDEPDTLPKYPRVAGTYVRSSTNYVVTIKVEDLPSPIWPTRPVYRIIQHEGVEYLFDERDRSLRNYERSKDAHELRSAWRREGS